eukprot:scaffold36825_cov133-Skeletonema_dohrnii-CCMP3373.AAC.3
MMLLTPAMTVGSARECPAIGGRAFLCRVADFVGTFGVEECGVASGFDAAAGIAGGDSIAGRGTG